MSYENTQCPCGNRKLVETMLCDDCERTFASTLDRKRMDDLTANWSARRGAAIRVLAQARRRRGVFKLEAAA